MIVLAVVASVLVALALLLWHTRAARLEAGAHEAMAVAAGLERQIDLQVRNLDRAMRGLRADALRFEALRPDAAAELTAHSAGEVVARNDELAELRVAGGADCAGAQRQEGLAIGPPERHAVGAVLPLALAMPGGRCVLGLLRVARLDEALRTAELSGGLATLMLEGGTVVARSVESSRYLGADLSATPLFTEQLPAAGRGSGEITSSLDGVERVFAYVHMPEYPFVVAAGLPRSALLAQWWTFALAAAVLSALMLAGWGLLAASLRRGARRRRAHEAQSLAQSQRVADAEAGERAAQAQYRFLFERHPLPVLVFDREDLRILEVNDSAAVHYGHGREAMRTLSLLDLLPGKEREPARRAMAAPVDDAIWRGSLRRHLRADGSVVVNEVYGSDLDFDGRPARLLLMIDVTDRLRAEAELALSEERFRLVARATSDAIWDLDVDSGALWWSESFFQLFEHAPQSVARNLDGWEALVHADDRARVAASLEAAIADPQVSNWEARYRLRCGTDGYAQVVDRGFILREAGGRAVRAVGSVSDISQRLRDEADLRVLRNAVHSAEDGIAIADAAAPDLPLVYVNPAFERITGYGAAEVLGRNCRFLQGADTEQPARDALAHAVASQREARVLLRNYRKNGEMFWNELLVAPVRDESGAITHFLGIQNDVTERQRIQEQIAHRATHDELTGVPNRQLLIDRLEQAIRLGEAQAHAVGVAFVDLDDFKLINDSLGHAVGDEVLRTVAARLLASVGPTDTVARFGGDEFVLLASDQPQGALGEALERAYAALAQPIEVQGAQLYVTPSIGYARYPDHGAAADLLLRRADLAMYQAKQRGRNCIVAYEQAFDRGAGERLQLVLQLREALRQEQFVLAFQLQFDRSGTPVGVESLLRWKHPERGLLAPGHFIGVCEESGLIVPIGRWVLREAARRWRMLADAGFGDLRVAVNVSAMQFQQGIADDVAAVVREFELPRGVLEIELTESVVMSNPEAAVASMQRIRGDGVCIAIDDFGTGYSSLAYLKRLPLHRLKIDRAFVRDLGTGADDETICSAIIRLAQSLGLKAIAEGVETEAQWRWLQDWGCDEVQGFLFARPMGFDDLLRQLRLRGG
ncbi:EAL domain-containing protein [Coralloluteibacterium stylophorae]|uniref:EAL domain-containing protein n=1 Tax=Coralloluteibacterium stylophorae TaxID=1776034 RepID=A0A8J7VRB6_9GAMM|nr:EAL domain-containing protein [Coralloluteibacterium stylophorae]